MPGRRGCCHPRPPQFRTCTIRASGSSRERFADGVVGSYPATLPPTLADRAGVPAFSSVWLSMSYRGQVCRVQSPFPCFSAWFSPRDAPLPSFGSQRAWFPALSGTMKALRLPTCASAVTYFVRFRRPHGPSCFVSAVALLEGRRSPPGPGFGCRLPVFPAFACGRKWDLSGLQVIHPVPLLRS
jgi:hypothetical protein